MRIIMSLKIVINYESMCHWELNRNYVTPIEDMSIETNYYQY